MGRIQQMINERRHPIIGNIVNEHIILDIKAEDLHYWSPQLNFRVEPDEEVEGHSIVAGLIGPRPAVWTLFMFIYFSIGTLGFFISSYGVARWMLNEYSHALWAFPLAILFMLTAYKAGKVGEQMGRDQVEMLKYFVLEAITVEKKVEK
ncbi:MAG: hypothetical protein AAGG75_12500 [Bacteroidota bacterium]